MSCRAGATCTTSWRSRDGAMMRPINLLEESKPGGSRVVMLYWPTRSNHVIVIKAGNCWRLIPLVPIRAMGR